MNHIIVDNLLNNHVNIEVIEEPCETQLTVGGFLFCCETPGTRTQNKQLNERFIKVWRR